MVSGYVLVESIRPGSLFETGALDLRRIDRHKVSAPAPGRPEIWTSVEFAFRDEDAEPSPTRSRGCWTSTAAGTRTSRAATRRS